MPPMGLNTAAIADFSGGINLVDQPLGMDQSECYFKMGSPNSSTKNVEIQGNGERLMARRAASDQTIGTGTIPAASSIDKTIGSLYTYRVASADKLIMSNYFGGIWLADFDGTNFNITNPRVESGSALREWVFQHSTDSSGVLRVYATNGTDTPQTVDSIAGTIANWPGTPPNGTCLSSWKNRMIVSGVSAQPQRLYYSDINNPGSWPANNFIDIKSVDDELDYITGLRVLGENLLVFKRNSVWLVFDPITFDNRRIGDVGLVSRKCVCSVEDTVYWVSLSGIYSTDGESIRDESLKIKPMFQFSRFSLASSSYMSLIATYEGKILWVNAVYANTSQLGVWELNLTVTRQDGQHPWFYHGGNAVTMKQLSAAIRAVLATSGTPDAQLVTVGIFKDTNNANAQVFTFLFSGVDGSVSDAHNSLPLNTSTDAQYVSPWIALQGGENEERVRRVNLVGKINNTVTVKTFTNLDGTNPTFTSTVAPTSNFGRVRPESRGRFHQILVQVTGVETLFGQVALDTVEIKYRGGTEH